MISLYNGYEDLTFQKGQDIMKEKCKHLHNWRKKNETIYGQGLLIAYGYG